MEGLNFQKLTRSTEPSPSCVICSSLTLTGPSLVFLCLLGLMKWILVRFSMEEPVTLFFFSSFFWLFLPGILTAAFFGALSTRYVSEKIFSGKNSDLSASILGIQTVHCTLTAVGITVLCLCVNQEKPIPMNFMVPYYLSGVLFSCCNTLLSYLCTIREYRKTVLSHIAGMGITAATVFLLQLRFHVPLLRAMYWGLTAGLFFTCFLLSIFCIRAFGSHNGNYFEFLTYAKKHSFYILSDFCLVLSLYLPGILMWFLSPDSVRILIFRISPQFDLALILALGINVAGIMLFEVRTQTRVFGGVLNYLTALQQGSYEDIRKQQQQLQREMALQLFFSFEVQLVTVLILTCLLNVLSPYLGLSSQVLNLSMVLSIGMYGALCMHFTQTFLHYFDDGKSALPGPLLSLTVILLFTFLLRNAAPLLQALPFAIGSILGWILTFLLLRKRLSSLTVYYFCK